VKKLLIFLAILLLLLAFQLNGFASMTSEFEGDYILYNNTFSNTYFPNQNEEIRLTFAEPWDAQLKRLSALNVRAETLIFKGGEDDIEALIKKLRVKTLFTQKVGSIDIIYGYSPRLKGGVYLDGQKVNLQIARRGEVITAGTPVILGSY